MVQQLLGTLTTQKATAAVAGALTPTLFSAFTQRIPGGAMGQLVAGALIAWGGAAMLDGHAEAFVIGVGVGMVTQGLVGLAFRTTATA